MIYMLKIFSAVFLWVLMAMFLGLVLTRNVRKNGFKERCGWYLSFTAVLILFLFGTKPVSNLLIYLLERDCRPPFKEDISGLDAVIILAGGVHPCNMMDGRTEASGATYSRLFNGVRIFKENNAKLLVLSGTSRVDSKSDAVVMAELAEQLGVSPDRMIIEVNSRNTLEQAVELKKIFPVSKKLRLGIVTSALHMRRAAMVFRREFSENVIVPLPVAYLYSALPYRIGSFIPSWEAFASSDGALHELIGIAWYSLIYNGGLKR